jgi:hypothetical protein
MSDKSDGNSVDTRKIRHSLRLTFRFDGSSVDLISSLELRKIAPATVGTPPVAGEQAGVWLELRDEHDKVLFHRLLDDPFRTAARHHSPDGRIELHLRAPQPGEFEVLVPALPDASYAALLSSPLERDSADEPAQEIGRYPLQQREPRGTGEER